MWKGDNCIVHIQQGDELYHLRSNPHPLKHCTAFYNFYFCRDCLPPLLSLLILVCVSDDISVCFWHLPVWQHKSVNMLLLFTCMHTQTAAGSVCVFANRCVGTQQPSWTQLACYVHACSYNNSCYSFHSTHHKWSLLRCLQSYALWNWFQTAASGAWHNSVIPTSYHSLPLTMLHLTLVFLSWLTIKTMVISVCRVRCMVWIL